MTELDYSKLGLKVGLEIHQQLNTSHKLFCNCDTSLNETFHVSLERYLRPSFSELGEVDIAALFEWKKDKKYVYKLPKNSCLVECDEEPPHLIDEEALGIVTAIALSLHSTLVDEVYVMRKIVIDGSNTSGFQRTAIIALGGYIEVDGNKIGIQTISLEEDASRKISDNKDEIVYNLDRLGVTLIEISTAPDIHTPEQAEKVAFAIGQLLRMTGKVKRGIGTIRQDLNVSIQGGVKTEIKGVQRLELVPEIIRNEATRQYELLKIKEELTQRRGVTKELILENYKPTDLTSIFASTNSRLVKKELEKGALVYGVKIPKFRGIFGWELMKNRRFGTEVADYVRVLAGLGGLFHSDELPNYGISQEEVDKVKKALNVSEEDAFVLVVGDKARLQLALDTIRDRILYALEGIPKETRTALEDGTTKFMRPQRGSASMYPETDIPPRRIDSKIIELAKTFMPEKPESKLKKFVDLGLSKELATAMLNSTKIDLFEELVNKYSPKVSPSVIASVLEVNLKYVKSKGGDISIITDDLLEYMIRLLYEDEISKDSIPEILLEYSRKKEDINKLVEEYSKISDEQLEKIVDQVIQENIRIIEEKGDKAFNVIMGKVMSKVRGKVEGKKVAEIISKRMKNYPRS